MKYWIAILMSALIPLGSACAKPQGKATPHTLQATIQTALAKQEVIDPKALREEASKPPLIMGPYVPATVQAPIPVE